MVVVVAVIALSAQTAEFSLDALVDGLPNIADFVGRMFPPDLSILPTAFSLMGETIAIAVIGTVAGVLLALPLALLVPRPCSSRPGCTMLRGRRSTSPGPSRN